MTDLSDPHPVAAAPSDPAVPANAAATSDPAVATRFDTPTILSVSAAHMIHDSYPAFVGVLLPLLIAKLDLSLAGAGLLAATFRLATGVQPFLGHVADRSDTRYWIILAPAATALAIGMLGLSPSAGLVAVLLIVGGISSSVFHPAAAVLVTHASGKEWGRGTSIFMAGGESGRAAGPLLIAAVLTAVGLAGSWIAIVPGFMATAILYLRLARRPSIHLDHPSGSIRAALRTARRGFLLLVSASALLSLSSVGLLVFVPTYLTRAGADILLAGAAVTAFSVGGVAGAFVGGTVSDRIGRRQMLAIACGLGSPLLMLAMAMPIGPAMLVALALAGVALLSAGPVQLVLMQELLPDNRGAAVGLAIFAMTISSAIGSVAVGALGDVIGLQSALILTAAAALLALPFITLLPETRHVSRAAG
jgi:FSR family fosmidomycin resistance protein-like MFS transporter